MSDLIERVKGRGREEIVTVSTSVLRVFGATTWTGNDTTGKRRSGIRLCAAAASPKVNFYVVPKGGTRESTEIHGQFDIGGITLNVGEQMDVLVWTDSGSVGVTATELKA